jgi:hypothetical protein
MENGKQQPWKCQKTRDAGYEKLTVANSCYVNCKSKGGNHSARNVSFNSATSKRLMGLIFFESILFCF